MTGQSTTGTPAGSYRSLNDLSAALNRALLDLDRASEGDDGNEARKFVAALAATLVLGLDPHQTDIVLDSDLGSLLIELKHRPDTPEVREGLTATMTALDVGEPLPEDAQRALFVVSSVLESELSRRYRRLVAG